MGVGGSTTSRNSPITAIPRSARQISPESATLHRPGIPRVSPPRSAQQTEGCCSHRQWNHADTSSGISRNASKSRRNSVDEDIEEIVANTLDLPNTTHTSVGQTRDSRSDHQTNSKQGAPNSSKSANPLQRLKKSSLMPKNEKPAFERVRNDTLEDVLETSAMTSMENRKSAFEEVDFEKFRRVNHKGSTQERNGKLIHHQDSDLLWRLGLISPETYTMKNTSRSAPPVQEEHLKPPSYDLTEEQLMANIEKEFAELTGKVN